MNSCPFINLLDPASYAAGMPYDELARLRAAGPVVRMDDPLTGIPYWVVTRQQELDYVSKNPALFSSARRSTFPAEYDDWMVTDIHQRTIIGMDPPEHQTVRRIVRAVFTPKNVEGFEPALCEHAGRIVDAVAGRGECEFVEQVAAELPLIAILELLGVPIDDRKQFFDWTNTMIFADDPEMSVSEEAGQLASAEVIGYAMRLAEEHRRNPKPGLLHYHTINHDEQVFGDDAMRFDVRRTARQPDLANQLRSFGIGQHFCIGSHLARLELRIMMEEIIPRLRKPRFVAPPRYVQSFFVNAIKEMRIAFDPEAATDATRAAQ